ncbi:nucleoside triphosphate pyrophosphohydrolase family protein [Lewinella sp. JB7]|uniref:nucleoside triphosphate pyrophosphohydrolase family protein n=1 Tax=Lewinella sp. JB7 TaxID=2962887 RepID=UPI0020CA1CF9|nr:nucleoside triphosphate pyrophosphohydrolase family protein [Lewinella sp. JB7]MCP9235183.1 nucleoside triphosphate pyrophosphohydrolase family protein [Lewinella sp. JB7]
MNSPDALGDVAEFHRTFRLPILSAPAIPPADRCRLRLNLLQEELDELRQAIDQRDIVEVADALADLQYVLSGAVLEFGLGEKFRALFEEVHRSNMSKTCASREEAEATLAHYRQLEQEGRVEPSGEVFLVYRNDDNKVLKNVNYSPADLAGQLK